MGIGACCVGWKALDLLSLLSNPTMSKLSPAAQAVLNAYRDADIDDAVTAAAVLRAAADQMSSHHSKSFLYSIADVLKLQTIANEPEAQ